MCVTFSIPSFYIHYIHCILDATSCLLNQIYFESIGEKHVLELKKK